VRTIWALLVLAIALVLGWNGAFAPSLRFALLVAIGLVLSRFWVWWNLRGLRGEVESPALRVQAGQRLEVTIGLRNPGFIFKPLLLLKLKTDLPKAPITKMFALPRRSARAFTFSIPCPRRGWFHLGPAVVGSRDPFGLFNQEIALSSEQEVLVYPRTVELSLALLEAGTATEESLSPGRMGESPLVRGVREYLPGDSFSRVHWPSSARMRKLMSKELEGEGNRDVWLLLDMEGKAQAGEGEESTEEYGVAVAASLCKAYIEADRSIALVTWDKYLQAVPPGRGAPQLWRIMEVLSMVEGGGKMPLPALMAQTEHLWRASTLAIITPSPEQIWYPALDSAVRGDSRIMLFMLDASTFDTKRPAPGLFAVSDRIAKHPVRRGELWRLGLASG